MGLKNLINMKKSMVIIAISILIISFVSAEFNETNNVTETNETVTNNVTANNETGSFVSPEFNETEIDEEQLEAAISEAGITPDNIFYGADVFLDDARATITPSALGKAKVRLDIIQERMAEMVVMANKNKTTEAKRAELEGQKQMEKFERSVEKIKKKDAPELNNYMQRYNARLEDWKLRMTNYGQPDYIDAIADAIRMLETTENVIVNIPEDLDPESIFKISLLCEEAGATTVDECNELISSGALTARVGRIPEGHIDPHNCSGFWASRNTKWCCADSDGTYSSEWIERRERESMMTNILNYYYRKGTVEYKIINLETNEIEQGIETDSCDGNTLTEWFCPRVMDMITRNERFSVEYECPYRCEHGTCIREIIEEDILENIPEIEGVDWECIDSDGDQDYFVKGTVVMSYAFEPTNMSCIPGPPGTSTSCTPESTTKFYYRTDYCFDGVQLIETSCDNNQFTISIHSCPNGCQDGACMGDD